MVTCRYKISLLVLKNLHLFAALTHDIFTKKGNIYVSNLELLQ